MPIVYTATCIQTPIGCLEIQGNEKGISTIAFTEQEATTDPDFEPTVEICIDQLEEYFAGKRKVFDSLSLRFAATPFQEAVWNTLLQVPFGQTISYGKLAEAAGYKDAARAVGTAMNKNPLAIVIPCHRVVPETRGIGEYGFGVDRKQWLLEHELAI